MDSGTIDRDERQPCERISAKGASGSAVPAFGTAATFASVGESELEQDQSRTGRPGGGELRGEDVPESVHVVFSKTRGGFDERESVKRYRVRRIGEEWVQVEGGLDEKTKKVAACPFLEVSEWKLKTQSPEMCLQPLFDVRQCWSESQPQRVRVDRGTRPILHVGRRRGSVQSDESPLLVLVVLSTAVAGVVPCVQSCVRLVGMSGGGGPRDKAWDRGS